MGPNYIGPRVQERLTVQGGNVWAQASMVQTSGDREVLITSKLRAQMGMKRGLGAGAGTWGQRWKEDDTEGFLKRARYKTGPFHSLTFNCCVFAELSSLKKFHFRFPRKRAMKRWFSVLRACPPRNLIARMRTGWWLLSAHMEQLWDGKRFLKDWKKSLKNNFGSWLMGLMHDLTGMRTVAKWSFWNAELLWFWIRALSFDSQRMGLLGPVKVIDLVLI